MDAVEFKKKFGLKINGNLHVNDDITSLPDHLVVKGNLILPRSGLKELPAHLKVTGHLSLRNTSIIAIGPHLTVNGMLNLNKSQITSLPEYVTVGKLKLKGSSLEKLPPHLTINGNLDLMDTPIKELGEYLTVRKSLRVSESQVKRLPRHLWVGGSGCRPSSIEEWGGYTVLLEDSLVSSLPDYFYTEELYLKGTNISSFGKEVEVVELWLGDKKLEGDPEELKVANLGVTHADDELVEFAVSAKPGRKLIIYDSDFSLPDRVNLDCTLRIEKSNLRAFPDSLSVNWLELVDTPVEKIGKGLRLADYGSIRLEGANINCKFEEGINLPGLELVGTSITSLPDEFTCNELIITQTPLEKLPEILFLKDNLVLNQTALTFLPKILEVGNGLNIGTSETKIVINDNIIRVAGSLSWQCAPFETWPVNMLVFDNIDLEDSRIQALPDDFLVNGSLILKGSKIKELPRNLTVLRNLDISHTAITKLPEDLKVYGKISARGTSLDPAECEAKGHQKQPEDWNPSWQNGKFMILGDYGACEILQDNGSRKLARQIGLKESFWVERNAQGKWQSEYHSPKSAVSYFGYLGPGFTHGSF